MLWVGLGFKWLMILMLVWLQAGVVDLVLGFLECLVWWVVQVLLCFDAQGL